jgi:glycosyltransferase involved in cell wall biosynthesis
MPKRIVISTSNDISTDNRVHKVAMLLLSLGYEVHWVGRMLPTSTAIDRPYEVQRLSLVFKKGALFYAELQVRLFFFLLTHRSTHLLSNDLDTLLPNYLVSRLFHSTLIYDTHEYFCGVPELEGRWAKKVWQRLERSLFPRVDHIWTVNESIADLYEADYGKRPKVFRNISPMPEGFVRVTRRELGLPEDAFIAINQGSGMNVDRGLEEAVEAIAGMSEEWMLLLVGSGDAIPALKESVRTRGLESKVVFVGRVPYAQLLQYTAAADVGLSLDKDTNINYRFSLPNKLFDYLHCGIPVVTSPLVEVARIVEGYGVGATVEPTDIEALRNTMVQVVEQRQHYTEGIERAQRELNWAQESEALRKFYDQL